MDFAQLQIQWCDGQLYSWLRERFGSLSEAELDRHFGRWIDSEGLPFFERATESESDVRRWCWSLNWSICSQDEDLWVMDDRLIPTLLEEVHQGCPKSTYLMDIVCHHMRDTAHAALRTDLKARLMEMRKWLPLLERLPHVDLSYPRRLLGYADPGRVDRGQATRRVLDLRRCDPQENNPPRLMEMQGGWSCLISSPHMPQEFLFIDRRTGFMGLLSRTQA